MSRPVYAVVTTCNIKHGRITTSNFRIEPEGHVRRWASVLEEADREMRGRDCDTPHTAVTVAMVTSDDTGAIRSTPIKRCTTCDCFKVPGQRHKHDPRLGPKKGNTLRVDQSWARWTGDNFDDMHSAHRNDPRWQPITRGYTVKVLSVEVEEAWSYDGREWPAVTVVKYRTTLTGDWTGKSDDAPEEGAGDCGLPEWREWMRGVQLVERAR